MPGNVLDRVDKTDMYLSSQELGPGGDTLPETVPANRASPSEKRKVPKLKKGTAQVSRNTMSVYLHFSMCSLFCALTLW